MRTCIKRVRFTGLLGATILCAEPLMAQAKTDTPPLATPSAPAQQIAAPIAPPQAPVAKPAIVRISEKLPISTFAQLDFVEEAHISPDGTKLAGIFAINGERMLMTMPLVAGNTKPIGSKFPDGMFVNSAHWANNDYLVVRYGQLVPVPNGDKWYVTRTASFNVATGSFKPLLYAEGNGQNASDVLWMAQDGSNKILLAAQETIYSNQEGFWPSVFRVDLVKGNGTKVVAGTTDVREWVSDAQGVVRMGLAHDDDARKMHTLYRDTANGSFRTVDKADLKAHESVSLPFMFLPEAARGLMLDGSENGETAINEYNLLTMEKVRTVYKQETGRIVHPILSKDEKTLLGVYLSGHQPVHWFDPVLAKLQDDFSKAVPSAEVSIISMDAERKNMLVKIEAADMTGSLYIYNVAEGVLHRISHMNAAIGSRHLAEVKMLRYKARDGLEIEAKVTFPTGHMAKNLPTIMLPHGGPWAYDGMDYDYWSQFLANRCYLVIQPNFRGSKGYGANFEDKGDGQMGAAMQDDISDGLHWAVEQGYADPKRTCILGASYGGYAAMWGIVKDPDQYRCAVSIAGVSNVKRENKRFDNSLNANEAQDHWKRMAADFDKISPIFYVDKIKAPLLLIHGMEDTTVDVSESEKMNGKMLAAGKKVEMVLIPKADHYFLRQPDREVLLTAMENFLNHYNPAD
jgi:dienelactone hydrolase